MAKLFLMFILYSFIGWVYESAYVSFLEKRPVNRGFLTGPLIPIYGAGALLVLLVFQNKTENLVSLFLSSAVLLSILEYITSWGMEKLFHARWWDYSTHRFHINGRVCLGGATVFGLFSVLLIRFVNPVVSRLIDQYITGSIRIWASLTLLVLFLLDLAFSIQHVVGLELRLQVIQEAYDKYVKQLASTKARFTSMLSERFETSTFYTAAVQKLMGLRKFQDIRLLRAYPHATFLKFKDAWERLKEQLKK